MGVVQELVIQYRANVTQAVKGLEEVNRQVKRTNQAVDRSIGALTSKMQSMGTGLTIGVTAPLLLMGRAAVKSAMDAVESENLFAVSMGKMATQARTWSQSVSKSLGLNSYEIRKNVATFNVMFESMKMGTSRSYEMAKGLTQLSYDMASFYNLRPDEAFQKLQAGISGETEPLKRLGILINETTAKTYAYTNGIAKQGVALTEQQKVLARYGLIMESTSKAQGDMARTLDSPTNALRSLTSQLQETSITFGTKMIPAVEKAVKIARDYTKALGNMTSGQIDATLKVLLFAAVAGPLTIAASKMVRAIMTIRAGWIALAASANGARLAQMAAAAGPVGWVAAGAGAVLAGGMHLINKGDYDAANKSERSLNAQEAAMVKKGWSKVKDPKTGDTTMKPPSWTRKMKAQEAAKLQAKLGLTSGGKGSLLPANPFKLSGKSVVPKIKDLEDEVETPKQTPDEKAQASMSWVSDSYTLKRITPTERIAAYKRIIDKNKKMSLSMLAQVSTALWQAQAEVQKAEDEITERNTKIAKDKEDERKDKAAKKSESIYNARFAGYETRALGMEAKGNQMGADMLRNHANYMAETYAIATKGKQGYDVTAEMELAKKKYESVNNKITMDNAKNIWERIKSYRQEADEKRKSVAEMAEAERRRQRDNIQWIHPGDIWRTLMADSVRRQYGPNRNTYVPGNLNGPAKAGEVAQAQLDIKTEAETQTTLLTQIRDRISPVVHASEMLPNAY